MTDSFKELIDKFTKDLIALTVADMMYTSLINIIKDNMAVVDWEENESEILQQIEGNIIESELEVQKNGY